MDDQEQISASLSEIAKYAPKANIDRIAGVIGKYEGKLRESVARNFANIASSSPEALEKVINLAEKNPDNVEFVSELIGKYDGGRVDYISSFLHRNNLGPKEFKRVVGLINSQKFIDASKKSSEDSNAAYELLVVARDCPEVAENIAEAVGKYDGIEIGKFLYALRGFAKIDSKLTSTVIDNISKYNGDEQTTIARDLLDIEEHNSGMAKRVLGVIKGIKGKNAGRITNDLREIVIDAPTTAIETVMETIRQYNPDAAGGITYGFNKVVESYLGEFKKFAEVMKSKEVIDAVGKYSGDSAADIVHNVLHAAISKNPEELKQLLEAVNSKEIIDAIGKYQVDIEGQLVGDIGTIARITPKRLNATIELIKSKRIIEAVGKYKGSAARKLAQILVGMDGPPNPEEKVDIKSVEELAEKFNSKKIVDAVGRYSEKWASTIVEDLSTIATEEPQLLDNIAESAGKYEEFYGKEITNNLVNIGLNNPEQIEQILEMLKKYPGEQASDISRTISKLDSKKKRFGAYVDMICSSKRINERELERMPKGFNEEELENLSKETATFREKVDAMELYKSLNGAEVSVNQPSTSNAWKHSIAEKIEQAMENVYGVKGITGERYIPLLLIPKGEVDKKGTKDKIKEILETDKIKKNFRLGEKYEELIVSNVKEKESPVMATRGLVYGLLSKPYVKDKEGKMHLHLKPLQMALKNFDKLKLRQARKYMQGIGTGKMYAALRDDLKQLEEGKEEAIAPTLDKIRKMIVQKGDKQKVEPISDMVAEIEGIGKSTSEVDSIVFRMQSAEIEDLFDNRTTNCCAFFPNGVNSTASIGYLKDPDIGLLQAKAVVKDGAKKVETETSGTAILVNTQDDKGNSVLLVDSVESGSTFDRIEKYKQLNQKFFDSIMKVAKENKASKVVFNAEAGNAGPRQFNEFLAEEGLKKARTKLKKKGNVDEEFYLESFGGWKKPVGVVDGYVAEVN